MFDRSRFKFARKLHPQVVATRGSFEMLKAAVRKLGDLTVARRMVGISQKDMEELDAKWPGELEEAVIEGDKNRITTAITLLETARGVAMMCEDAETMLAVGRVIAPELFVYPAEAERQRARQEFAQPSIALQINQAMPQLGAKLQEALKSSVVPEDLPAPDD